ncbi:MULTISPECIES: helix-turn-helix domain-containing protein [unclassified Sphingobium]|uniref:helix-turn-helix domain-containing protein n=1 Tax=unclassified Sphingobium TaxID=2611147 RepID=UPI0007702364|nr:MULTISPECIES: helix-turn-helix domain-containing protein [unclassified Sphingobium]AMK25530.1 Xre-family transcriptional regulator [Sphingobium sp. TKS]NML91460.1 helix-turn-helix domain-containing protein [Sphingobium sp. TB-6]
MPIHAIVDQPPKSDNRRGAARWRIRLELPNTLDETSANVVIHDISTAGMLIDTKSQLKIGQSVMVSLPDADKVAAHVVWQNESLFGCRFDQPLPQGVVSAVRLRSPSRDEAKPIADRPEATVAEGLPERLRRLRQERGLSRAALSEQTGFSKPTIWGWETGRTMPRKDNLHILSGIFGLTEQQLLFGKDNSPLPEGKKASPEPYAKSLKDIIDLSKTKIAEAAGVNKFKVHIYIEY